MPDVGVHSSLWYLQLLFHITSSVCEVPMMAYVVLVTNRLRSFWQDSLATCRSRLPFCTNVLLQRSHLYWRRSRCERKWCFTLDSRLNCLSQIVHLNCFFLRPVVSFSTSKQCHNFSFLMTTEPDYLPTYFVCWWVWFGASLLGGSIVELVCVEGAMLIKSRFATWLALPLIKLSAFAMSHSCWLCWFSKSYAVGSVCRILVAAASFAWLASIKLPQFCFSFSLKSFCAKVASQSREVVGGYTMVTSGAPLLLTIFLWISVSKLTVSFRDLVTELNSLSI